MPFKKGDVVVCVDGTNPRLVLGQEYVVHDVVKTAGWDYVCVEGVVSHQNPKRHVSFFPRRFELKEEKKPEPIIPGVYPPWFKFKGDEFKDGDKVVIRESFLEEQGKAGDIVTIDRFYKGIDQFYIKFHSKNDRDITWAAWRFSPINPEPAVAPILEEGAIMAVAKKEALKVGDKVKCSKWKDGEGFFGFVGPMEVLVGKVGVITAVVPGGYQVQHKGADAIWNWNKHNVVKHVPRPRKPVIQARYAPKVGDKVITNKFAEHGETRHDVYMTGEMVKLEGTVGVIVKVSPGMVRVEHPAGDTYWWPNVCLSVPGKAKKAPKAAAKGVVAAAPVKVLPDVDNGLRKAINAKIGDKGNPGCCTFGWQYAKSKENHIYVAAICHAPLNRYAGDEVSHLALHLRNHYDQSANKKEYKDYVKYVLNDSPFKTVCLTKDVEEAITLGVLLDVTKTSSEVASTAVVLRQASEFPVTLKVWKEAKEKGATDHEAYLISTLFHQTKLHIDGGHSLYSSTTTVKGLVTLIKEGVKGDGNGEWGKRGGRYEIYNTMNRGGDGRTIVKALDGIVCKVIGDGWQKKFTIAAHPVETLIGFWRGALNI